MFMPTMNVQKKSIVCRVSQTTSTRGLYVIKHICGTWILKNTFKNTRLAKLPQGSSLLDLLCPGPGNSKVTQTQPCCKKKTLMLKEAQGWVGTVSDRGEVQMESHESRRERVSEMASQMGWQERRALRMRGI